MAVFWNVTAYYQSLRGNCCLHFRREEYVTGERGKFQDI
jgi:hypothetical protein